MPNNPFYQQNWGNQASQQTYQNAQIPQSYNYYANTPQVQQNNNPTFTARFVNNPDEIRPQEVPMNGAGMFPQTDGQVIYVKTWTNNGMIRTDRYILEQPDQPNAAQGPSEFEQVMQRLNKLEDMLVMINPDLKAAMESQQINEVE